MNKNEDNGMRLTGRYAAWACGAGLLGYAISFFTSSSGGVNAAVGIALLMAAVLAFRRSFTLGVAVVFGELVVGSLGRLFVFPGGFSIRMGLFALALLCTAYRIWKSREDRAFLRGLVRSGVVVFLGVAVLWGVARGLFLNMPGAVIGDANAYAYFLLLPTFLLVLRDAKNRQKLLGVILGASVAAALLTLIALHLFTHATPEPILRAVYKWVRDFGLGEITRAPGGFYRVFFQAHLWNFIVFLWSVPLLIARPRERWFWLPAILSASVVFISFSRTFWLAAMLAALFGAAVVVISKSFRLCALRYCATLVMLVLLGLALPFAITKSVSGAAFTRAGSLAGEAAADSRMNLLRVMAPAIQEHPILGWGFGKELIYITRDPRLLAYFPDGRYTTYAFEWGWLDFWLKMGVAGLIAFLALVLALLKRLWERICATDGDENWLSLALFLSLFGVSFAHLFSPWLNHPLGIGLLLLIIGTARQKKTDLRPSVPLSPSVSPPRG